MVQQHKTCTKCGETKTIDGFHKDKTKKDGLRSQCKPCKEEFNRRYYEANREKELERVRRYQEENRERVVEKSRRYYETNREEVIERSFRYYAENRDIANAKTSKSYREAQKLAAKLATVPPYTPWTHGEDALILADNSMTIYQKAIELGRTFSSVRRRREKLLAKLNA